MNNTIEKLESTLQRAVERRQTVAISKHPELQETVSMIDIFNTTNSLKRIRETHGDSLKQKRRTYKGRGI